MEKKEKIKLLQKKIHGLEKQLKNEKGDCLPCVENILVQIRKHQFILIEMMEKNELKS